MAINTKAVNPRRTVTKEVTDTDFSDGTAGEETVAIPELKDIESVADVTAQAVGTGDSNDNEGYVARPISITENGSGVVAVVIKLYQGGGAGAPLDDAAIADLDHLYIRATGQ